jgi:hypothetical protein
MWQPRERYRPRVRTLLLLLVAAACTKTSNSKGAGSGAECPALSVTANGVSLPAMTNGLAFSYRVNGTVTWHVDLSDHANTCERYMGKDGRILQHGEETVSASTGGLRSVGIGNELRDHDKVEIVGATPSKPGDKLTLCVIEASFTTAADTHKGEKIVMDGKLEGTYCGEQKKI